jgi:hypothetical protein
MKCPTGFTEKGGRCVHKDIRKRVPYYDAEWDSSDQYYRIFDKGGKELDNFDGETIVEQYIKDHKKTIPRFQDSRWEYGDYVLLNKDGGEIDRIYVDEIVKKHVLNDNPTFKFIDRTDER